MPLQQQKDCCICCPTQIKKADIHNPVSELTPYGGGGGRPSVQACGSSAGFPGIPRRGLVVVGQDLTGIPHGRSDEGHNNEGPDSHQHRQIKGGVPQGIRGVQPGDGARIGQAVRRRRRRGTELL